ncbi:MAG: FHA domain-containing protein [bacterium]|nr:FHA domain-containing protein [bacterium]
MPVTEKPTLIVSGKGKKPEIYQIDQKEIFVGRDDVNFVVLPDRAVSRRHFSIQQDGGAFFVTDLKSANGTFLNERKITTDEKNILRPGDKLRIEKFEILFQMMERTEAADIYETTDTDILEVKMIKKILKAIDKEKSPSLEVLKGEHAGKKFMLEGTRQLVLIGRDPSCEWPIDDDRISRKHAKISRQWDTVTIEDLKSKNGIYVNNKRVKRRELRDGDVILLGTLPVRFKNPQDINMEALAPIIQKEKESSAPKQVPDLAPEPPSLEQPPSLREELEEESSVTRRVRFSSQEILWIILGGAFFLLCLWGIVTLFK